MKQSEIEYLRGLVKAHFDAELAKTQAEANYMATMAQFAGKAKPIEEEELAPTVEQEPQFTFSGIEEVMAGKSVPAYTKVE